MLDAYIHIEAQRTTLLEGSKYASSLVVDLRPMRRLIGTNDCDGSLKKIANYARDETCFTRVR